MTVIILLLLLDFALTTALSWLNLAYLKRRVSSPMPPEWAALLDTSRFPQMVAYREAHTWLAQGARTAEPAATLGILLSGLLPALARWAAALPAARVVQGLAVLAALGAISYLVSLPWGLLSDFGVERKFGFSTITWKTWLSDQVKSLFLVLVLGVPLAGVLLFLIERMGETWWLPAWGFVTLFQLLVAYIAPTVIFPLFNKFEPLQDEALKEDIFALARKAGFPLGGVFQINASLRSTHANAYFTGFGKNRRIALFDTLLEQLSHHQILAVLAHEIGHWKKRHVLKGMAEGVLLSGLGLAVVAWALAQPWLYTVVGMGDLYRAVGPVGPVAAVGLYVFGIVASPLGLLLAPIANGVSRRREYEADAFSLELYDHPTALEEGLIRLTEKNLSNLFPHPLAVIFYHSHPPLLQRVEAIRRRVAARGRG
ncbi:MAG: M48 family metallopeptidase [Thermoflexales bacterium]|nr:M48 family metallopeptidase [Thermoflexales bacterium]